MSTLGYYPTLTEARDYYLRPEILAELRHCTLVRDVTFIYNTGACDTQLDLFPEDREQLGDLLKTPWSDGTTHLLLSPLELLEKLAALVPPPRLNLIRYQGVLAPNASVRQQIVPSPAVADEINLEPGAEVTPQVRAQRRTWAALLSRIFDLDGSKAY